MKFFSIIPALGRSLLEPVDDSQPTKKIGS